MATIFTQNGPRQLFLSYLTLGKSHNPTANSQKLEDMYTNLFLELHLDTWTLEKDWVMYYVQYT